jgi:hypothetical protein
MMDPDQTLPLMCPRCRRQTAKPIRWVQENTFFTCSWCGGSSLIDKDEATKLLAEITRRER